MNIINLKEHKNLYDKGLLFKMFDKQIILGNFNYDSLTFDLKKRIANLYRKRNGWNKDIQVQQMTLNNDKLRIITNSVSIEDYNICRYNDFNDEEFPAQHDLCNINYLLNDMSFVTSMKSNNEILFTKYKLSYVNQDNFQVILEDKVKLYMCDNNLVLHNQYGEVAFSYLDSFLEGVDYLEEKGLFDLCVLIFNSYCHRDEFFEIEKDYREYLFQYKLSTPYINNYYSMLKYIYYFGRNDFYLAFYKLAKIEKRVDDHFIHKYHPCFTGHELTPGDIPSCSKIAIELGKLFSIENKYILEEMEQCNQIGEQGIAIIYDYFSRMRILERKYDTLYFGLYDMDNILRNILIIIKNSQISIDELMKIATQQVFQGMRIDDFLNKTRMHPENITK